MMYLLTFLGCIQLFFWTNYIACVAVAENSVSSSTDCNADVKESWSYRTKNGPLSWSNEYIACGGQQQSPVAINSMNAIPEASLPKLTLNGYDIAITKGTIQNNGRTIMVTPSDGIQRTIFVNGSTYNLTQFHFHWGNANSYGSEHMIDGFQHSMEMHFVHQNTKKQIAVVAAFFQEQSMSNIELQNIVSHFPQILYKDSKTRLTSRITLNNLLPSNPASYFRYYGSLTTPGCNEGVTWSLLFNAQAVGIDQMEEFRKLYSVKKSEASSNCKISNNFRPIQPLNNRLVFLSQ